MKHYHGLITLLTFDKIQLWSLFNETLSPYRQLHVTLFLLVFLRLLLKVYLFIVSFRLFLLSPSPRYWDSFASYCNMILYKYYIP